MYRYMMYVLLGSFIGCLLEMVWYYGLRGKWMSRKGVLWGLFSPIYGIAIAGFVFVVEHIVVKNVLRLFMLGAVLGSSFEYIASVLQEKVLGTKSWDYSKHFMNINGRISLGFTFIWGTFSVVVAKVIKPAGDAFYAHIDSPMVNDIIGTMFFLFMIDCFISILVCVRQKARWEGKPAVTPFQKWADEKYNDEKLARIYTEIRRIDQKAEAKEGVQEEKKAYL